MGQSRQDDLLATAVDLFDRNGFRATGIDRIVARSGATKMTLYHHFRSKDELIAAALARRDAEHSARFAAATERRAASPRQRLLAVFDVLADWIAEPEFRGCLFARAAAEYGDADHPAHRAAAKHMGRLFAWLQDLARAAGAKRPYELAAQLMLLANGATLIAQVTGARDAAAQAKKAAETLLAAALN